MVSGAECFQDATQGDAANLEAGKPGKPLPIKYHTQDGMHRIDLIDDEADDETYRAFQLARYTGDANMQVRQHEEKFLREREEARRREESTELGEQNDQQQPPQQQRVQPPQQPQASGQDRVMGHGDEALLEVSEGTPQESGRKRIMGSDGYARELGESDTANKNKDLGESAKAQTKAQAKAEAKEEAFEAVHVSKSGDIEDNDQHFVMTNKLRHKELKEAVLGEGESSEEKIAQKLALKMEQERAAIAAFEGRQHMKNLKDEHKMAIDDKIHEALKRHHLMQDKEGRLVPDF